MYYRAGSMQGEVREQMRGGGGSVVVTPAVDDTGKPGKARLVATLTMEKGCGIGEHDHIGETEIYYCVSGNGIVVDDGKEYPFGPGDSVSTGGGKTHSIRNENDETLVVFAVIILD